MKNKIKYPDKYSPGFVKFLDENFIIEDKKVFKYIKNDDKSLIMINEFQRNEFKDAEVLLYVKFDTRVKKEVLSYRIISPDLPEVGAEKMQKLLKKIEEDDIGKPLENIKPRKTITQYNAFTEDELKLILQNYELFNGPLETFVKYRNRDYIQMLLDIIRYVNSETISYQLILFSVPEEYEILCMNLEVRDCEEFDIDKLQKFLKSYNQSMVFWINVGTN